MINLKKHSLFPLFIVLLILTWSYSSSPFDKFAIIMNHWCFDTIDVKLELARGAEPRPRPVCEDHPIWVQTPCPDPPPLTFREAGSVFIQDFGEIVEVRLAIYNIGAYRIFWKSD